MGVYWKIIFLWGFTKKQCIEGNCLKRGTWTVCRFRGGGAWWKRGRWCFWGWVNTPTHCRGKGNALILCHFVIWRIAQMLNKKDLSFWAGATKTASTLVASTCCMLTKCKHFFMHSKQEWVGLFLWINHLSSLVM